MSKPYTIGLSGAVKVDGPTWNAAASDCADQSGWSWNLGGNTASCPGVIDALDPANKPALLRNTTQSTKASGVLSLSQVREVTARDLKVPDTVAGIPLALSDGCTVDQSEFMGEAFARCCHNHSYAVQDLRDPPVPIVDEPRWGVTLPRVKSGRDDNFIDHLRVVDDGHDGRPGHKSLIWIERPPDPPR